jgi:nucleoside-diphosphate-sugar epimerase
LNAVITGATGFLGRTLVPILVERGHDVIGVARRTPNERGIEWPTEARFISADLHSDAKAVVSLCAKADFLVHLAWPGLPAYESLDHFEVNLPAAYRFLKSCIANGIPRLVVAGTCQEYGLQEGALPESTPTRPMTAYAIAKDCLRIFLECLQRTQPFTLQWLRLFYLYGPGQSSHTLFSSLNSAIARGDKRFPMSGGEQLRDYLAVDEAGRLIASTIGRDDWGGALNICSGRPIKLRQLVAQWIADRNATIVPEFGAYPYLPYEPMAFWGDNHRLTDLAGARN